MCEIVRVKVFWYASCYEEIVAKEIIGGDAGTGQRGGLASAESGELRDDFFEGK